MNAEHPLSNIEDTHNTPLEAQFETQEVLEIGNEKLGVIDITPEELKTTTPTVFLPGWGATPRGYKENILGLARLKRRVLSLDAPHGITAHTPEIADKAKIPDAALRKISALFKLLEYKGLERVNIVAHSEAGLYTTFAATLYPEKFKNIVLVNPAGLTSEDSPLRALNGFRLELANYLARNVKSAPLRDRMLKVARDAASVIMLNPRLSLEEALSTIRTQVNDELKALKKQGVRVSLIHGVDDNLFPPPMIQNSATADQFAGVYSVAGGHTGLIEEPEQYTRLIDEALSALDELEEKQRKVAA
jgi:pimeloyl-ACP methyl ester carboxylesterase